MLFDLNKASEDISKYADVLSQILKVDVEIVDQNLKRIAGTGRFKEGEFFTQGDTHIFKKIIETGQMLVIDKPGFDKECIGCVKYKCCDETFEMSTPIKYEGVPVGAIGLICFDDNQRLHILENFATFSAFLEQISDLIVSKVVERMDFEKNRAITQLFHGIFETIEDGILVVDERGRISNHNKKAKEILCIEEVFLNGENIEVVIQGKASTGHTMLDIKIDGQVYHAMGEYVPLHIDGYHRVIILKDEHLIQNFMETLKESHASSALDSIIGQSPQMVQLKDKVQMIALSNSTVLITGESGTGKELFARAIHDASDRKNEAFIAVNCGALPDNLIESELFGYVKGAFTGADVMGKDGKFLMAHGGTIFLDEIGEMPIHLQVKILRVLEERIVYPLGSSKKHEIDIRVIAATNRDLSKAVKEKRFRDDLYYRLNVIPIKLPSLRERKSDLKLLSTFFLKKYEDKLGKTIEKIDISFWKCIESYDWKGNVRELQNVIEYALNMVGHDKILTEDHLPQSLLIDAAPINDGVFNLESIEKGVISRAIKKYGTYLNKHEIANILGIGIATLYRKIEKYGL